MATQQPDRTPIDSPASAPVPAPGGVSRRAALRRLGEGGVAAAAAAAGVAALSRGATAQDDAECWFRDPKAVQEELSRGSEQLLACWFGEKTTVDAAHLKQMLELSALRGVRSFEWFPLGTPRLDAVIGTMQLQPEVAPQVVAELVEMASTWRHWEVFPYGTPVPDLFEVAFGARGEFPDEQLPG